MPEYREITFIIKSKMTITEDGFLSKFIKNKTIRINGVLYNVTFCDWSEGRGTKEEPFLWRVEMDKIEEI